MAEVKTTPNSFKTTEPSIAFSFGPVINLSGRILNCNTKKFKILPKLAGVQLRNFQDKHTLDPVAELPVRTKKTIRGMLVPSPLIYLTANGKITLKTLARVKFKTCQCYQRYNLVNCQ